MSKPTLHYINAFDSTKANTITFSYLGNQAQKNRLTIRNNITNVIVYDQEQTTMQLNHTIPANTLTNGTCYNATIKIADISGTYSPDSNKVIFYAYTTPSFSFSNLSPNQIINNSSFSLLTAYSQAETEELDSYQVILYNALKTEIQNYGTNYTIVPILLSNLLNKEGYYVRAIGKTVHGFSLDTGYIPFSISYSSPSVYSAIELENVKHGGFIRITSHLVSMEGKSSQTPIYIDGKMIDLRNTGATVTYDEGFLVSDDFYVKMRVKTIKENTQIIDQVEGNNRIKVTYVKHTFNDIGTKVYVVLQCYTGELCYTTTSNMIDVPLSTDLLDIEIIRVNNLYQVKLSKVV